MVNEVPAEVNPGTPYEGACSDAELRLPLAQFEQLEFQSSLHPREIAIMIHGWVRDMEFDVTRTANIALHWGGTMADENFILYRYEVLSSFVRGK